MKKSSSAARWLVLFFFIASCVFWLVCPSEIFAQDERPVFTVDECVETKGGVSRGK
jgi:alkyl hydroperoxide reductase subunit AhpC